MWKGVGRRRSREESELATLQGVVTGPNQAPIPGVLITARDLNAGTVRTARTGNDRFYFIGGIIPSEYALRIQAIGSNRKSIQFASASRRILNGGIAGQTTNRGDPFRVQ